MSEIDELPSAVEEALAKVQEDLNKEKEGRREERFIWILVTVILTDILILGNVENVSVPLVVLALELIALTVVARRLEISSAAAVLDRFTTAIAHKET